MHNCADQFLFGVLSVGKEFSPHRNSAGGKPPGRPVFHSLRRLDFGTLAVPSLGDNLWKTGRIEWPLAISILE